MDPLSPFSDGLLPAAMRVADTAGRRHGEPEHPFRNPFQRDRDRIIHAAAFRRLEYKTQVFVNGEGDHYRTRLTHTLEVTQIARTMARALGLNEDLAEAVALSHDLGHTPFGHAGERLLNDLLADCGGFNHNAQGLRVVDRLEKRYAAFDGLNLSREVREGFVRHGGRHVAAMMDEFAPDDNPLLEVAVTMAADDIAYIAHDIDDGLYSGILQSRELVGQELWRRATDVAHFGEFSTSLQRAEGVRRLINLLASDLVESTRANIARMGLDTTQKVRQSPTEAVEFSVEVEKNKSALKAFLFANLYRHPNVMSVMADAQEKLRFLFGVYAGDAKKMPLEYQKIADIEGIPRAVADYVAGMTDRFVREEWVRFFRG